jgi:uroporphyrinogen decarboxylase
MNSRERILLSLEHKEPDRVPYGLAGSHVTGIHVVAYKKLCNYLGIDPDRDYGLALGNDWLGF